MGAFAWGGERLRLSNAARRKREESRRARRRGTWPGWMGYLARGGAWPGEDVWADRLRPRDVEAVALSRSHAAGRPAARRDYVGLVYADGNAMGRLVQELDSAETTSAFSAVVDEGVHEARRTCRGVGFSPSATSRSYGAGLCPRWKPWHG